MSRGGERHLLPFEKLQVLRYFRKRNPSLSLTLSIGFCHLPI